MSEDPRMRLTLADCRIETPMLSQMRAVREARQDVDAPYLGQPVAPAPEQPFSFDDWAEDVARGVTAGLRARSVR